MDYSELNISGDISTALDGNQGEDELSLLGNTYGIEEDCFHESYEIIPIEEFEERLERYLESA